MPWRCLLRLFLLIIIMSVSYGDIYGQHLNSNFETPADTIKQSAGDDYIQFYQRFLSEQKNSHCAMFPSCSDYGRLVLQSVPYYKAIPAIADRLMRCSRDKKFYIATSYTGSSKFLDLPSDSLLHLYKEFRPPYADVITEINNPLAFINHLINVQDYNSAMLEIRREQFYRPNDALYLPKLICYRGMRKPLQAVFEYETEYPEHVRKVPRVNYQAALAYYELDNYEYLRSTLNYGILNTNDSLSCHKMHTLKAISYVKEERYDSATIEFLQANDWKKNDELSAFNKSSIIQLQTVNYKSPALAKSLSIIPGLGYLYTGHKGSALTAFLVNGLLGCATYSCFDKKNYAIGAICGFLNLSFYVGNLNGAARSAHRYNQLKKNNIIHKLETRNQILLTY